MSNQLAGEISQYLLQHAENPVEWHAWNAETLGAGPHPADADFFVDRLFFLSLVPRDGP